MLCTCNFRLKIFFSRVINLLLCKILWYYFHVFIFFLIFWKNISINKNSFIKLETKKYWKINWDNPHNVFNITFFTWNIKKKLMILHHMILNYFNENNLTLKSQKSQMSKYWMALPDRLPNDNFSPESGGNVNPNRAIEAISTHGTIKLKK